MGRAYVTQSSPEPIVKPDGSGHMHLADSFLADGRVVAETRSGS